jgi:hypothetical protein
MLAFASTGALGCARASAQSAVATSKPAAEKECPIKTNTATPGEKLTTPIELSPTQQSAQRLVNLGTSRAFRVIKHLTVTTSKPLPASVESDQIGFEATLSRTGNTLETDEFPDPTFSPAYISDDRRSISFAMCLNPAGVSAGQYVGSITVSGPEGMGSASIGLTVNAKDGGLFWVSGFVALAATLALLVLKDMAAAKTNSNKWGDTLNAAFGNPLWYGATAITLVAAFGTLYNVYANDPSWGASGFSGLESLVGTATAAVGGHTILTALGSRKS